MAQHDERGFVHDIATRNLSSSWAKGLSAVREDAPQDVSSPDPLGGVLAELRVSAVHLTICDFIAPWALQSEAYAPVQMFAVAEGCAVLAIEGSEPFIAYPGDLIMVTRPMATYTGSAAGLKPQPLTKAWTEAGLPPWRSGSRIDHVLRFSYGSGPGERLSMVSFTIEVAQVWGQALLRSLPAVILIKREEMNVDWIGTAMQNMLSVRSGKGHIAVALRLAELLFIAGLRTFLAKPLDRPPGWLHAIADRRLCVPVSAIMLQPGDEWTLQTIARAAGMSRSSLARHFSNVVGTSPADFVTGWRMCVAADWLLTTHLSVKEIARRLRYATPSAFGAAFRQRYGVSPRAFGRQS